MHITDESNFDIIEKLVIKHFSLDNESNERFKKLLRKPESVDFIEDLFKDSPDNRISWELDNSFIDITEDEAWEYFQKHFSYYTNKRNITHSDFVRNKITSEDGKGEIKIKKDISLFYLNAINGNFIEMISFLSQFKNCDLCLFNNILKILRSDFDDKSKKSKLKNAIDSSIIKHYEVIGTLKKPNRKLKVVMTRNYADWFLCSTEENWNSCLNLKSSWDGLYWSGLPGLIADPNRVMFYITDGKTKEFQGIKTERFLQRFWAVLSENNDFMPSRTYPDKKVKFKEIKEATGLPLKLRTDMYFTSKSSFKPLFFDIGQSCFIYQDNSTFSIESNNKVRIYSDESTSADMYIFDRNDQCIYQEGCWNHGCNSGILDLISQNCDLHSFCSDDSDDSDDYYEEDDY